MFRSPAPPPPPGFEAADRVVFFRTEDDAEPRGTEDLLVRRVPRAVAALLRAAAGARQLTHGQYLSALVHLHAGLHALADEGDERIASELEALGLTSVTV